MIRAESIWLGGSPALVVSGGDWRTRGEEFESCHQILDGSFITFSCCKIALFQKNENNEQDAMDKSIWCIKTSAHSL